MTNALISNTEQKHAKKRSKAKRYLLKNGIKYNSDDDTYTLVALARYTKHNQVKTITAEKIIEISKKHHYLRQLVACKQMWGINSTINFVGEGTCRTIADLIKVNACPKELIYLDKYLHLIANRLDL